MYLYLINYSKSNPELALLAVNAFVRDATHRNPMIRALAVRTMGCIRVERITEYLEGPLKTSLGDEDPYVRKTAAMCVAKLFDIAPALVHEHGFLDSLRELLSDGNPTVVANAVAALTEIHEASSGRYAFEVSGPTLQRLLAALNECTEWGQVFILDAIALLYKPADATEAEMVVERVSPRLAHQNAAVVLSAAKVVLLNLDWLPSEEAMNNYRRRLSAPLVTLAQSSSSEVQYVALRNIRLIVQRMPNLLRGKIKVFFCKYNDPIYVKLEKLDLLVRLVADASAEAVLAELKEYAQEVDVEYVRRAVRTIGRVAIKLEGAAEKAIKVLLSLITDGPAYVVQEGIVVVRDIFRRYPGRYESVIGTLCENLEGLDEPEAKAAMAWILGEYADRIENAAELLETFVESWEDDAANVQLALLTACVKAYLHVPDAPQQELVQRVLQLATEESDNPDLRDRGYVYWRLLSTDADVARAVVLAEKPVISDDINTLAPDLLNALMPHLGSLAALYAQPPSTFVRRAREKYEESEEEDDTDSEDESPGAASATPAGDDDLDILGGMTISPGPGAGGAAAPPPAAPQGSLDDILGLGMGGGSAAPPAVPTGPAGDSGSLDDLFGGSAPAPAPAPASLGALQLPTVAQQNGITVHAAVTEGPALLLGVVASSGSPLTSVAVAVNINALGLNVVSAAQTLTAVPGQAGASEVRVPLKTDAARSSGWPLGATVDVALRDNTSGQQTVFKVPVQARAMLQREAALDRATFIQQWQAAADPSMQGLEVLRSLSSFDEPAVLSQLTSMGLVESTRQVTDMTRIYLHASVSSPAAGSGRVLVEATLRAGTAALRVATRSTTAGVAEAAKAAIAGAMQ